MDLQTGNCKFWHLWRYVKIIKLSKYYFITFMLTYLLKFHFNFWRHGSWSLFYGYQFSSSHRPYTSYFIPYTSYFHLKNCQCEWIICNKKYISISFTKTILWNEIKWKLKCYIFYFCLWSLDNLFYKWCTEKLYEKTNTALVTRM